MSPFPGVRRSGRGWAAYQSRRRTPRYLGTYDSPEAARAAVLLAMAAGHEAKARAYRDEADSLEET